ncbi:MAG: XdhC family protein [Magnetovibrionaceae bacterium]
MAGPFREFVIDDLARFADQGLHPVLATLVHIEGSGPRPAGAQMAIGIPSGNNSVGDTAMSGFISGGCVEDALAAEAERQVAANRPVMVDYGEGSQVWDIRLPCGSRIHVCLDPLLSREDMSVIQTARIERRAVDLVTDISTGDHTLRVSDRLRDPRSAKSLIERGGPPPVRPVERFARSYLPPVRLILAGTGPVAETLARLARDLEYEVIVLSGQRDGPDIPGVEILQGDEAEQVARLAPDPWTGVVSLYHDHDRELAPLMAALETKAFYVGALGSRRVQDLRLAALAAKGFHDEQLRRIDGPAGLPIGAANPPEIALAILARVTQSYRSEVDLPLSGRSAPQPQGKLNQTV